jgi:hypothetical protein
MRMLDGNAVAGTLGELFGVEMTTVVATCSGCGKTGMLAETGVYVDSPGIVVRCRTCDTALIVIVERRGVFCVDLSGVGQIDEA